MDRPSSTCRVRIANTTCVLRSHASTSNLSNLSKFAASIFAFASNSASDGGAPDAEAAGGEALYGGFWVTTSFAPTPVCHFQSRSRDVTMSFSSMSTRCRSRGCCSARSSNMLRALAASP